MPSTQRRSRQAFDTVKIEAALRAALASDDPPPTLRAVGQRLGYSNSYLRLYFPDLCDAIVGRWRAARREQKARRLDRSMQEIYRIADALRVDGIYPSAVRIIAASSVPLRMMEPECDRAWRAVRPPHWITPSKGGPEKLCEKALLVGSCQVSKEDLDANLIDELLQPCW
jgi:hypothetical protein